MARQPKSVRDYQIVQRRAQVATLVLSGIKQRKIAEALKVSDGTISKDLKALFAEWKTSSAHSVDTARLIDLERIEAAIAAIWLRVKRGELQAIDRLERLLRLRMEILGYGLEPAPPAGDGEVNITIIEVIKDYGPPETIDGEVIYSRPALDVAG